MPEMNAPAVDAENEPVSSLTKINIAEQIEYYFGDYNMMKDKFLKQEVTKNNGWIPISTLLRFNRLAALSKDVAVILSALKENPSDTVEVNSETKFVRRNPLRPIPEDNQVWRSGVAERTVYAKGFPSDTTTLDDILDFMRTFGKIDHVFKRCYHDKALKEWKFKGSVYITFPTKEDAEKFLDIKSVKFAGNELVRKWQNEYIEEKKNERLDLKLKVKESKSQLVQEQTKNFQKLPTGALLALTRLTPELTVLDLRRAATEHGWDVAFIEYNMGSDSNAYVRLQTADSAEDALSKLKDGSFVVKGVSVKAEIVTGEREREILKKMESEKNSRILGNLKSGGKKYKNKSRKNFKADRNSGSRNYIDRRNDAIDTSKDSNGGTPAAVMQVETSKLSSEIDAINSQKVNTTTALDGGSAEAMCLKNEKPDQSEESTLKKRKTQAPSPEATKKAKSEDIV